MAEVIRLDDHVTVELESESVVSERPAEIKVLKDGVVVLNVKAEMSPQSGADMGLYPAVKFIIIKVKPTK